MKPIAEAFAQFSEFGACKLWAPSSNVKDLIEPPAPLVLYRSHNGSFRFGALWGSLLATLFWLLVL